MARPEIRQEMPVADSRVTRRYVDSPSEDGNAKTWIYSEISLDHPRSRNLSETFRISLYDHIGTIHAGFVDNDGKLRMPPMSMDDAVRIGYELVAASEYVRQTSREVI